MSFPPVSGGGTSADVSQLEADVAALQAALPALATFDASGMLCWDAVSQKLRTFPTTTLFAAGSAKATVATANLNLGLTTTSVDATLGANESIIGVDSSAGVRRITLESAARAAGKMLRIQDETGQAGTNTITVDTENLEKINTVDSVDISSDFGGVSLYSDGANWFEEVSVAVAAAAGAGSGVFATKKVSVVLSSVVDTISVDFAPHGLDFTKIFRLNAFATKLDGTRISGASGQAGGVQFTLHATSTDIAVTTTAGNSDELRGTTLDVFISYDSPAQPPVADGFLVTTIPVTISTTAGIQTLTPHGLDLAKIRDITSFGLNADTSPTEGVGPDGAVSTMNFNVWANDVNIVVQTSLSNSGDVLGRTIQVLVTHET